MSLPRPKTRSVRRAHPCPKTKLVPLPPPSVDGGRESLLHPKVIPFFAEPVLTLLERLPAEAGVRLGLFRPRVVETYRAARRLPGLLLDRTLYPRVQLALGLPVPKGRFACSVRTRGHVQRPLAVSASQTRRPGAQLPACQARRPGLQSVNHPEG